MGRPSLEGRICKFRPVPSAHIISWNARTFAQCSRLGPSRLGSFWAPMSERGALCFCFPTTQSGPNQACRASITRPPRPSEARYWCAQASVQANGGKRSPWWRGKFIALPDEAAGDHARPLFGQRVWRVLIGPVDCQPALEGAASSCTRLLAGLEAVRASGRPAHLGARFGFSERSPWPAGGGRERHGALIAQLRRPARGVHTSGRPACWRFTLCFCLGARRPLVSSNLRATKTNTRATFNFGPPKLLGVGPS